MRAPSAPRPRRSPRSMPAPPRVNWYCDPEGYVLREALARHHGVARENIGLGIGADDLLGLIVRAFIDPGDPVVMSHGAYPTFAFHVAGFGGKFVHAALSRRPQRRRGAGRRRAGEAAARLVYLSNPDNPTGSWLARRRADGDRRGARRPARCWCSTRPIAISRRRAACRRSIPRIRASSACAPSPRRMAWRGCASAMPSRRQRSSPPSTRSATISA